jgi:hypothetical protein
VLLRALQMSSLEVRAAGLSTLLCAGSIVAMVPAEGGCSVISGGGSAAWAVVPAAGARIPGAGARAGLLGAECCHLAGQVLVTPQKCGAVGEWNSAHERRLGCGLEVVVRTVGRGVQVALGLAGENGLYGRG